MNEIILKDPAELTIHPLAKAMQEWTKDDPRFGALVEDIRARGIDKALLIDAEGRIVDGRMVWKGAKQLQLAEVACKIVPDHQIAATIINSLVQRKHYTKSALAYLTYPLMKPAYDAAVAKRRGNLLKGQQIPDSTLSVLSGSTVEELAEKVGISRVLFFQAKTVHGHFADDKDYKALMEPKILQEPMGGEHEDLRPVGLGAVIAGWKGRHATLDQSRQDRGQLDLFTDGLGALRKRFGYWEDFTDSQKIRARQVLVETACAMPDELQDAFIDAIKASRKAGRAVA